MKAGENSGGEGEQKNPAEAGLLMRCWSMLTFSHAFFDIRPLLRQMEPLRRSLLLANLLPREPLGALRRTPCKRRRGDCGCQRSGCDNGNVFHKISRSVMHRGPC